MPPLLKKILKVLFFFVKATWYIWERVFLVTLMIALTIGLAWWLSQKPSLYRDWSLDHAIPPTITFSGNLVDVKNVRNFIYRSTTDYTP